MIYILFELSNIIQTVDKILFYFLIKDNITWV